MSGTYTSRPSERTLSRFDGASDGGDLWRPKEHEATDLRTLGGDSKHYIIFRFQILIFLIIGRFYRTAIQLSIYTNGRERYECCPYARALIVFANDITEIAQPL